MANSKHKIIVVMPAYNAEKTIRKTYNDIPKKIVDETIVVDDGSSDQTVKVAKELRLPIIVHPNNLGYGGNQKTCYREALNRGASIIVMIHPDYQYDARLTGELVKPILDGRFDIMLGSRIRLRAEALEGGMPLYKYIGNRFLTAIENIILGINLSEYHTGFRAFNRDVLKNLNIDSFSNDFVFDQDILVAAVSKKYKISEIAVPVRYFKEASSINFLRSVKYGLSILILLFEFIIYKLGIIKFSKFK